MDRRRMVYRLAGIGWLASFALILWLGQWRSMFGFYGMWVTPFLLPVELVLAIAIGVLRSHWAALSAAVVGPVALTIGCATAGAYEDPNAYGLLFVALGLVPLAATFLSVVAAAWPFGPLAAEIDDEPEPSADAGSGRVPPRVHLAR